MNGTLRGVIQVVEPGNTTATHNRACNYHYRIKAFISTVVVTDHMRDLRI